VVALLAIALVALVGQGSFTENVVGMYVLGIGFGLLVIGVGWIIRFILTGNKRVLP
jgi:hypothetical protein